MTALYWLVQTYTVPFKSNRFIRLSGMLILYSAMLIADRAWIAPDTQLIPIQFANGVALALVLLAPRADRRALLAAMFGAHLAVALILGEPFFGALVFAIAGILQPATSAWLLDRALATRITFERLNQVLALFAIVSGVSAGAGALTAFGLTLQTGAPMWETWLAHWIVEGLGMMLATPCLIVWARALECLHRVPTLRLIESAALLLALLATAFGLLIVPEPNTRILVIVYAIIPLYLWAMLRFGPRGAVTALGVINPVMLWNVRNDVGIFAFPNQSPAFNLLAAQILVGISLGVLVFATIVAERQAMSASLRESEERFRLAFENANIGMCLVALDGRLTRVNRYLCTMLGYPRDQLEQMTMRDITHSDFWNRAPTFDRDALAEDYRESEKMYVDHDGNFLWGCVSSTVVRDTRGAAVYFIAHIQDITDTRRAEEQLRHLSRAVEHSPASIVITDTKGNIQYVNPKFVELTGYTLDEVRGENSRILKSGEMPPDEYTRLWTTISAGEEWRGEFHNKKKNGELYWEFASISPLTDATGAITHYIAVKEDITTRKHAETQLRYVSTHDTLTGLYNRMYFEEEMARLERGRQFPVSVVMMDLDGLKRINDTEGHAAGDALLRRAAALMCRAFRAEDIVARIGGDEFAVLLPVADTDIAAQVVARVQEHCAAHNAQHPDLPIYFSLGAATAQIKEPLADALKQADARMYQAKTAGRA